MTDIVVFWMQQRVRSKTKLMEQKQTLRFIANTCKYHATRLQCFQTGVVFDAYCCFSVLSGCFKALAVRSSNFLGAEIHTCLIHVRPRIGQYKNMTERAIATAIRHGSSSQQQTEARRKLLASSDAIATTVVSTCTSTIDNLFGLSHGPSP